MYLFWHEANTTLRVVFPLGATRCVKGYFQDLAVDISEINRDISRLTVKIKWRGGKSAEELSTQ